MLGDTGCNKLIIFFCINLCCLGLHQRRYADSITGRHYCETCTSCKFWNWMQHGMWWVLCWCDRVSSRGCSARKWTEPWCRTQCPYIFHLSTGVYYRVRLRTKLSDLWGSQVWNSKRNSFASDIGLQEVEVRGPWSPVTTEIPYFHKIWGEKGQSRYCYIQIWNQNWQLHVDRMSLQDVFGISWNRLIALQQSDSTLKDIEKVTLTRVCFYVKGKLLSV